MGKTAYFDPRGCDFRADEKHISDVGNYRLVACVVVKTDEPVIIEFGGYKRQEAYTKKSGKTGLRVANENALHANGSHEVYHERPGNPWGPETCCYAYNFENELGVDTTQYDYTRADLLRFLSDITGEEYTKIEFNREKVDEQIETLYRPVERAYFEKMVAACKKIEEEREARKKAFFEKWRKKRAEGC